MTTYEYAIFVSEARKEILHPTGIDEVAAYEVSHLVSGSFSMLLYDTLWVNYFDMESITDHLESLYESGNHYGLLYFIFILADAADLTLPLQFYDMSVRDSLVPVLSAAIIDDWLDYSMTCGATEYES